MAFYSLRNIADITGGRLAGEENIMIRQLLLDSRAAAGSPSTLFYAIAGKNHDGHRFIPELYDRGIRAFVVQESNGPFLPQPGAGYIIVKDSLAALQILARHHRMQFNCPIVAITGSNGKTIVKEWLFHCLSDTYRITRSPKSYNSQIGVPLSLWLMEENTGMGVFEAGISRPGEMLHLQQMIFPDIGIFTNIGEAHQENFTSIREKISEKLRLFYHCQTLIYCGDHAGIDDCCRKTPELSRVRLFRWTLNGKGEVHYSNVRKTSERTFFTIKYKGSSAAVSIPYTDNASLENAMHCLALLCLLEMDGKTMAARLEDLPPVAMRLEQKSALNGCTLINDSYNSDFNSLSIALDVLNRQRQHPKKTLILSDILQSGQKQEELYGKIATLINEMGVSRIIGIGPAITRNSGQFSIPGTFYESTQAFLTHFNPKEFRDEAILIKGSRQFAFEQISSLLELKKHTTRIEINLDALVHNLNYFRSLLLPETKTMVMVKALSYGSGRHEIASILEFQRVDYLGVAIADEGISLRQAGVTLPVMVMNPEPESFDAIIQYRLEPEIYSFRILDMFYKATLRNQEIDYPVHLKLDTGMHRLGFLSSETETLCHELKRMKNFTVRSVFSHLAGSDAVIHDAFTRSQIGLFRQMSDQIQASLGYSVIRHILNSAGIERFPEAQFDMVRLGIGLYGISCVSGVKLKTVSTLKSTISQIKSIRSDETVGYGREGRPGHPARVAIVPIGYGDGLNRRLGNGKGRFLVDGKLVPIIGNICMDMTMIEVTNTRAKEGDEVVIFGDNPTINDLSRDLDTIPYEVLTGISERVKRVYIHE